MKKANKTLYERLHELLDYDPETGVFTRKVGRGGTGRKSSIAGFINDRGYRRIKIDCKPYSAHRLAWLYVYGYMPENEIDHKNRIKDDNRICNLREVSHHCNMRNKTTYKNNRSGIVGVTWHKRDKIWQSVIRVNNKNIHLGYFDNKLLAAKARRKAELEYNYPQYQSSSSSLNYILSKEPDYVEHSEQ